jgi:hypothetical protein
MVTVGKDTIDIEGEGHVLGLSHLILVHVLDLRDQDVTRNGTTMSSDDGSQPRHTRGSGNGEGGAKGVARGTTVPRRGSQAQVVHELSSIADGAPGGGDLNGSACIIGDGQRTSHAATRVSRRASRGGLSSARSGGSRINREVSVVKARHCDCFR